MQPIFYVKIKRPIDGHYYFCSENFTEIHRYVKLHQDWNPARFWVEIEDQKRVMTTSKNAFWVYRHCDRRQLKNFVMVKLSSVRV